MISVNIGNKKIPFPQELSLYKFKKVIKYDLSDIDNWYMILNDVLEVEENWYNELLGMHKILGEIPDLEKEK
jgi:hypothetical protein